MRKLSGKLVHKLMHKLMRELLHKRRCKTKANLLQAAIEWQPERRLDLKKNGSASCES